MPLYRARRPRYTPRRVIRRRTTYRKKVPKFKRKTFSKFPMTKSIAPFPMRKFTVLRYADYKVLTSTDTWQTQTYRMNSLYDPDYTGSGQQPQYYDTLCGSGSGTAPYVRSRVHGASVKIRLINGNSSGNSTGIAAIRFRNSDSSVLSCTVANAIQQCSETPNTMWKWVTGSGSDGCIVNFKKFYKVKSFFGVRSIDEDNFQAFYNSNPQNELDLDIHWITVNASASPFNLQVAIQIKYYVEFFDRNLPTSTP